MRASGYFIVSAIFHYLGPSFAVLLFARVGTLGVAWLRIASAAAVFGIWRRPLQWRLLRAAHLEQIGVLGAILAAMNAMFYLAIARLPLATVGAIEFMGTVVVAAIGMRTGRNLAAVALTTGGAFALMQMHLAADPLGVSFALANCLLFMAYVVIGHRIANDRGGISGIDKLALAMLVATAIITPFGLKEALVAFEHPMLLLAGAGVGVASSVIPYVTDQLAMARLQRSTFALMLALLPMFAVVIGAAVLHQIPGARDLTGIALVIGGVALHQPEVA